MRRRVQKHPKRQNGQVLHEWHLSVMTYAIFIHFTYYASLFQARFHGSMTRKRPFCHAKLESVHRALGTASRRVALDLGA